MCSMSHCLHVTSTPAISGSNWTTMNNRGQAAQQRCQNVTFQALKASGNMIEEQLTRYLAHTLVVLAAVSGFLTVGITVAHRFSLAVLKTLVVPPGAAVWTLSLPAARFSPRHNFPAEKRQISTNDKPKTRRAPSMRSHDGNLPKHTHTHTHSAASLWDGA